MKRWNFHRGASSWPVPGRRGCLRSSGVRWSAMRIAGGPGRSVRAAEVVGERGGGGERGTPEARSAYNPAWAASGSHGRCGALW